MTLALFKSVNNDSLTARFWAWNKKQVEQNGPALYVFVLTAIIAMMTMLLIAAYIMVTKVIPNQIEHNRVAALSLEAVGVESDVKYEMVTASQYRANPDLTNVVVVPQNFNKVSPEPVYGFVNSSGEYYSFELSDSVGFSYFLWEEEPELSTVIFLFKDYDPSLSFQRNIDQHSRAPLFSFTNDFYKKVSYNFR